MTKIPFEKILHTNGGGLWSRVRKAVKTTKIEVAYTNDDESFGELRIHFDPKTWVVAKDGLIYTDPRFLQELRAALLEVDLSCNIDYSEQGMQGNTYVSCDVGGPFIKSWNEFIGGKKSNA